MSRPHVAAIVEDAWHRQLERLLRRRGWTTYVIAHTGYGSPTFVRVFARTLLGPGARAESRASDAEIGDSTYGGMRHISQRGWRVFFTAAAMNVPVTVRVGSHVAHGRTDRSGHLDLTFKGHGLEPGWQTVTIEAPGAPPREARVFIVGPDVEFGMVSDIDDTVITTSLPRPLIAAWNTFVKHESARRVVAGMAPFYRGQLAEHPGAPIVYLSTGAWNTAPTLTRFLKAGGYPAGPLLMTDWGPTNTGWFRSGQDHKRACLDRLARDFPAIRWLLVGDDGQHDPKIYQDFAHARPECVGAVAIRQLTPTEQVLSHGIPLSNEWASTTPERSDVPVFYAPDGYGLARLVRSHPADA